MTRPEREQKWLPICGYSCYSRHVAVEPTYAAVPDDMIPDAAGLDAARELAMSKMRASIRAAIDKAHAGKPPMRLQPTSITLMSDTTTKEVRCLFPADDPLEVRSADVAP